MPRYGKKRSWNIVLKDFYGKNDTALIKCRTCGHCFGETRGTPFFGLTTSWEEVVRTLSQIPEKGSIHGVARPSGHDKGTICKWVDLAGKHCEEVPDYFLRDLHLDRIQVDEIWSYIKKAKEYHGRRS